MKQIAAAFRRLRRATKLGLLSSSVSITRYRVEGDIKGAVMETVLGGLQNNTISDIDQQVTEKVAGWTDTRQPFIPNFEGSSFVVGPYFVFSLRIDQKRVPNKVVQKYMALETAKKLSDSGREYLSREEKRMLKDHVLNMLFRQVPAVPNVYDLIWNYEDKWVWFFSNQKNANETVESLFTKAFNLTLVRLFPYTCAMFEAGLSDTQNDQLASLSPAGFME